MKRFLCAALFAAALASTAYAVDAPGLCCGRTATANFAAVPMPPLPPVPTAENYSDSSPVPANLPPTMSSRRASAAPSCSASVATAPSCSTPAASAFKPTCSTALTTKRPATAPTCAAAAPTCAAAAAPTCEANSVAVILCQPACDCCNRPTFPVAHFVAKQVIGRPVVAAEMLRNQVADSSLSLRERNLKAEESALCRASQTLECAQSQACEADCKAQARLSAKASSLNARTAALEARRAKLECDRAEYCENVEKTQMHRSSVQLFSGK